MRKLSAVRSLVRSGADMFSQGGVGTYSKYYRVHA